MHYYDVALGVEKHWDSAVFTYSSEQEVAPMQLVNVPFGRKSRAGVVVRAAKKPQFNTKPLTLYADSHYPKHMWQFAQWYQRYYAAKEGQVYTQLLPHFLTKQLPKTPKPLNAPKKPPAIELNNDQKTAVTQIEAATKPVVLHGVTGSGKTRVYLSLIERTLAAGKNALLLYPEIALTTQLLAELQAHAPVIVFHSALTDAARSRLWFQVLKADAPHVVIGPRSALFLPHRNLGLIAIDEAHESTFKQDTDIRYNAVSVAGGLSNAHDAQLVIGSATPPVAEAELIAASGGTLVCMHNVATGDGSPDKSITIIDRKDRSKFRKHPLLSDQLIQSIERSLSDKQQSLLFINRRGTAKLTLCEHCGWQADCPDCDLPMTYHHDTHAMTCHTCGKTAPVLPVCPDCEHPTKLKALGSKAIVDEVQRLFPGTKIGRFDTDTAKGDTFHEQYDAIRAGSVDILVGTQQIAKGLDLPLLSTVGVLDADLPLHFPDFSSDERVFQLISQVVGRIGRGHTPGRAYIQTLHPNNPVILAAKAEDWHGFSERELASRKAHQFPPYTYAAKVVFRDKSPDKAYGRAEKAKQALGKSKVESRKSKVTQPSTLDIRHSTLVDGPLPSFIAKKAGHHYVQLHLKNRSRRELLRSLQALPGDDLYDLDPASLL